MLAVFKLDWDKNNAYEKLTEENKKKFVDAYGCWDGSSASYIGDPQIAVELFGEITLKRFLTGEYTLTLQRAVKKLEQVNTELLNKNTFNEKCEVHVGGHALMQVNEVNLLEDCCTDVLQGELKAGWRIIAACVQPDGRRPDYIMGRYNPGKDN